MTYRPGYFNMPTAADLRCAYMRPGMSLTGVRYQIGGSRSTKAWMSKLANLERNFCRNVKAVRHGTENLIVSNGWIDRD